MVPVLDIELISSGECLSRFLQTRFSEDLMEWTQLCTNRAMQIWDGSWLGASQLGLWTGWSLDWPAKDHGKTPRVPTHTFKPISGGWEERDFPDCSFPFARVDLILSTSEFLDEENSPPHKSCLILLPQTVRTPLMCSLTASPSSPALRSQINKPKTAWCPLSKKIQVEWVS